jgi:hypothetical protein
MEGGAYRLETRACTRRGHPVASDAAAQPSALSEGRRTNTAKRGNLLGEGRPRSPSNTLRERGASILRSTHSPPLVVRHARDGRPGASRARPRRRVESW